MTNTERKKLLNRHISKSEQKYKRAYENDKNGAVTASKHMREQKVLIQALEYARENIDKWPGTEKANEVVSKEDMPIERLTLKDSTRRCLLRGGITRIGGLTSRTEKQVKWIRGIGEKKFAELQFALAEEGLRLRIGD